MNHEIIYAKTAAGEQAMLERTRTMARNVRMVLILVDSQSSVGDLCLKTGNPQLTESALRELERGGFIEPRRQQDAHGSQEDKLGQEVRAAVGGKRARQSAPGTPSTAAQSKSPAPTDAPRETAGASESAAPSSITSRLKGLFSRAPAAPRAAGDAIASPAAAQAAKGEGDDARAAPDDARDALPKSPASLRARRRRSPLGVPAIVALLLVALLALLGVTVWLFPYARYLPEVETAMSRACGVPVKVSALRVELWPRPQLHLGDVRAGLGGEQVRIAELRLEPDIGTLFSDQRSYDAIVLSGTTLAAETIIALPGVIAQLSRADARVRVGRIGFEKTKFVLAGLELPEMSGEVRLSAAGQFVALRLATPDRSLSVAATPAEAGLNLGVEALGWHPAEASRLLFDSINADAYYRDGTLTVKSMQLRVFDGLIEGQATINAGQGQSARGDLSFERINAARLGDAAGYSQRFAGDISGRLHFSTQGDGWAALGDALKADGEFSVQRGSVRGIDLGEAARRFSATPVQGGETRFESLEGKLSLTPAAYRFSELRMNSGRMQASGFLSVGDEHALNGRIELRMRGTANQTRIPLSIGGTLSVPTVRIGGGD